MSRTFEHKKAVREQTPLLVGLVGPSSSGKTYSALRLASGIRRVTGGSIFMIDTEAKRGLHYADQFDFEHLPFSAPFGPMDYLAAIQHCVTHGAKVIVIDSLSHEHVGPGGVLEMHEQEVERLAKGDAAKAERVKMLAWAKPKAERRRLINSMLQINCNFVFCFRAKEKLDIKPGKQPVALGFMPEAGEEYVYEMVLKLLLLPGANGVPTVESEYPGERMMIKIPGQFREMFARPQQLSEDLGEQMARWAAGSAQRGYGIDDLLAGYTKVKTRADWDAMEKARETVWKKLDAEGKKRAKAASERVLKLVTPPQTEKPAPPDAPEDHIPGVGDPANDALFDQSSGVPH